MKALFMGLGGIGQRHLRNLLYLFPEAQIGAVRHSNRTFEIGYDLQADYSVNIIDKYNIRSFPNLEEAVAWEPDFAVVSTPTSTHIPLTVQLIKWKIPVLLEKPISHNYDGLDDLMALAEETEIPVMIGYMLRFHPGVRHLLDIVKKRVIGRFYSVQIQLNSFMPAWHSYEKYNEFYAGRKSLGGGAILTEIHEIDLLHQMFGEPKKLWCIGGKLSPFELNVEDTVSTLFEYEVDGANLPVTLTMSFVQRPIGRTITLWGESGRIHWDLMAGEVTTDNEERSTKETFQAVQIERNQMFINELQHFIDCIELGKKPKASLQEVIKGHVIALKMKDSLENSGIISF